MLYLPRLRALALVLSVSAPTAALAQASQPASMPASMPAANAEGPASGPASMPAATAAPAVEEAAAEPAEVAPAQAQPQRQSAGDVTSRPGQSESAGTLNRGNALIEAGLTFETTLDDALTLRAQTLTAPSLNFRYGVFDALEVRASASYQLQGSFVSSGGPGAVSGKLSDLSLGATVAISDEEEFLPAAALIMTFGLPVNTLVLDDFGAASRVSVSKTFFDRVGLAGNLGASWSGASEEFTFLYTANASLNIGAGLGVFAELYGSTGIDLNPDLWVDGGVYYDVTDLVRLDAAYGISTLGEARNWWGGVGASILLPGT